MDLAPNLAEEMAKDAIVIAYLEDRKIAEQFYAALCNMEWKKLSNLPEDDEIVERLKGNDNNIWSCSWRVSGGIIADIRNDNYNAGENYMDFYCSGSEGYVSPLVDECFKRMGWIQHPY